MFFFCVHKYLSGMFTVHIERTQNVKICVYYYKTVHRIHISGLETERDTQYFLTLIISSKLQFFKNVNLARTVYNDKLYVFLATYIL